MSKSDRKNQQNWQFICYLLISFLVGLTVSFIAYRVMYSSSGDIKEIKIEIVADSTHTEKRIKAKLDSLLTIKLQNDIQLVEKKNDGRFEVLTWSSVLVITLLLVFITINFIVSSAKVREIVDTEMDKRTDDIKTKTESLEKTYKEKLAEMENLAEIARKESQKIFDYSELARQIVEDNFKNKEK